MINKKDIITFAAVLHEIEKRSTCVRIKIASLIIKDGRIISMGWNGVPSGLEHCEDYFKNGTHNIEHEHHEYALKNEIHAEQNAISYAARIGNATEGTDIISSVSPCLYCAKMIIAAGISNVYYIKKYEREEGDHALELLKKANVAVYDVKKILS